MKPYSVDDEEVMMFWKDLDGGGDLSASTELTDTGVALSRGLIALAQNTQPHTAFKKALAERLLIAEKTNQRADKRLLRKLSHQLVSTRENITLKEKRFVYGLGLAALLLVALLVVGPTLAQFALPHFAPREVEELPILPAVTFAAPLESITTNIIDELEGQAGFSLLIPDYVPPECQLREGKYLPEPIGEVMLVYRSLDNLPCFTLNQRVIDDSTHRPFIHDGSAEEITINGEPALYVDGMWVIEGPIGRESNSDSITLAPGELAELMETATWVEGPKQLVFERGMILLRLDGGVYEDSQLTKEELIRIAESME